MLHREPALTLGVAHFSHHRAQITRKNIHKKIIQHSGQFTAREAILLATFRAMLFGVAIGEMASVKLMYVGGVWMH